MISENIINRIIKESIDNLIMESFESSKIRDFFREHGGVNRKYRNFSAGDINDEQINFWKVFPTYKDAVMAMHKYKQPNQRGQRTELDMASHLNILAANDGSAAIVGVIRNSSELGQTWGGEYQKKVADRLNRNGWNFKTRDNRYVDDSDTYYYGGDTKRSPANDFGVYTNNDFKNKKNLINKYKEEMPNDSYEKWRDNEHKHLQNYMRKNYGNTGRVKYKK